LTFVPFMQDWIEIMDARNIELGMPSEEACMAQDVAICGSVVFHVNATDEQKGGNCTAAGICEWTGSSCLAVDQVACAAVELDGTEATCTDAASLTGVCAYTPPQLETSIVVADLDPDVNYIFTVIAVNIVGDSAHSVAAVAPPTQDRPIPDGTVKFLVR
jgi:hypothetical protein